MSALLVVALIQPGPPDIPPEVIEIVRMFLVSVVGISLGIPIIRAITRRLERGALQPPPTSPDLTNRLERIEQSVDAVAIEVERIAEGQRFVAKIMAEQQKQRGLPGGDAPR